MTRVASIVGVLLVGIPASVWTVRVAVADWLFRQETLAATQRALEWTPGRADYWVRLALLIHDSDPAASDRAYARAVTVNPRDAGSWIELGLRSEARGDLGAAERALLRAEEVDKQYLPKWTLANYYFRRGDLERFWLWARRTAATEQTDLAAVFRLGWQITQDEELILSKLGLTQRQPIASFLRFLLETGRIEPAVHLAHRLSAFGNKEDQPLLFSTCDRLLEAREVSGAVEIWNSLAKAHAVPYEPLDPRNGKFLTNADFQYSPEPRGFDWRTTHLEGVSLVRQENPSGLRVGFTGYQPEAGEVIWEYVPVIEGRTYALSFSYQTSGIRPNTGLTVSVLGATNGETLGQTPGLSSETSTEQTLPFAATGNSLVRVVLRYQRPPGATRIEGTFTLRNLRLSMVSGE